MAEEEGTGTQGLILLLPPKDSVYGILRETEIGILWQNFDGQDGLIILSIKMPKIYIYIHRYVKYTSKERTEISKTGRGRGKLYPNGSSFLKSYNLTKCYGFLYSRKYLNAASNTSFVLVAWSC